MKKAFIIFQALLQNIEKQFWYLAKQSQPKKIFYVKQSQPTKKISPTYFVQKYIENRHHDAWCTQKNSTKL